MGLVIGAEPVVDSGLVGGAKPGAGTLPAPGGTFVGIAANPPGARFAGAPFTAGAWANPEFDAGGAVLAIGGAVLAAGGVSTVAPLETGAPFAAGAVLVTGGAVLAVEAAFPVGSVSAAVVVGRLEEVKSGAAGGVVSEGVVALALSCAGVAGASATCGAAVSMPELALGFATAAAAVEVEAPSLDMGQGPTPVPSSDDSATVLRAGLRPPVATPKSHR